MAGDLLALGYEGFPERASPGPSCPDFRALCARLAAELATLDALEREKEEGTEALSAGDGPGAEEEFLRQLAGLLRELHCPDRELCGRDCASSCGSRARACACCAFSAQSSRRPAYSTCNPSWIPALSHSVESGQGRGQRRNLAWSRNWCLLSKPWDCPDLRGDPRQPAAAGVACQDLRAAAFPAPRVPAASSQLPAGCPQMGSAGVSLAKPARSVLLPPLPPPQAPDLTTSAFHWSERAEAQGEAMKAVLIPIREALTPESDVSVAHVLAARADLSRLVPATSKTARRGTCCAINKVLMGSVPDRGPPR